MIKHIVAWKMKNQNDIDGMQKIKASLEFLNTKIPGLIKIEVGMDIGRTASSYDLILYSEFESMADLENYQEHPLHLEAKKIVQEYTSERVVADYKIR